MALSQTQHKALKFTLSTRPTELITTFMELLFPDKLTAHFQAPLLDYSSELFIKHWTGDAGLEVLVPAYNPLELVARTCSK